MKKKEKNGIELSPLFKARFEEETRDLLISRTYFLFLITSILYPCFGGLDWLIAPDKALFFLYIRIAVGINFIICALLLKFPMGKRMALPISILGVYASILGVSIMTTHLKGFLSDII